jgi:hypothetical protein
MARTSLHKSLKQVLHGNEGSSGAAPGISRSDVLIATADTCINRENPNRDISSQENIVVGYDFDGTFDNLIKRGFTQGYWTLPPFLTPANLVDNAGARNAYLSRGLLEFDIKDSDAFTGGINHAFLSLTFSSHKPLANVAGITLDFHSFYCASSFTGGSNTGGATCGNVALWDGSATWYEWKYTGACEMTSGLGDGLSGGDDPDTSSPHGGSARQNFGGNVLADIGVAPPGNAIAGFTGNIWSHQGLGATGGMGQVYNTSSGPSTVLKSGDFLDYSQGVSASGHYDAPLMNAAATSTNFELYPSVYLTNREISSNKKLIIDITPAAKIAVLHNQGVLRIMVNVRHDFIYNRGEQPSGRAKDRAFVGFHSRETRSEQGQLPLDTTSSKVTNQSVPKFAPHLILNYNS